MKRVYSSASKWSFDALLGYCGRRHFLGATQLFQIVATVVLCAQLFLVLYNVHAKKKYQIWLLIPYQVINIILQTTGVVGKLSMKNFKYWHLVFYSVLQWFITLICCRIITIFIWIFPQHRNLYSFSLYQA